MNSEKLIALTFDDGPNLTTTVEILDLLEKSGIPASFFLIGKNISESTESIIRREIRQGCDICCHSTAHRVMSEMTEAEIAEDIGTCVEKIEAVTGKKPAFFRAPYLAVSETLLKAVSMTFISGIGSEDWVSSVTAETRAERILANAQDGQIVLLHDFTGNSNTVEAMDLLIPALKEQGYEFVTISELFKRKGIKPQHNKIYTNVLE